MAKVVVQGPDWTDREPKPTDPHHCCIASVVPLDVALMKRRLAAHTTNATTVRQRVAVAAAVWMVWSHPCPAPCAFGFVVPPHQGRSITNTAASTARPIVQRLALSSEDDDDAGETQKGSYTVTKLNKPSRPFSSGASSYLEALTTTTTAATCEEDTGAAAGLSTPSRDRASSTTDAPPTIFASSDVAVLEEEEEREEDTVPVQFDTPTTVSSTVEAARGSPSTTEPATTEDSSSPKSKNTTVVALPAPSSTTPKGRYAIGPAVRRPARPFAPGSSGSYLDRLVVVAANDDDDDDTNDDSNDPVADLDDDKDTSLGTLFSNDGDDLDPTPGNTRRQRDTWKTFVSNTLRRREENTDIADADPTTTTTAASKNDNDLVLDTAKRIAEKTQEELRRRKAGKNVNPTTTSAQSPPAKTFFGMKKRDDETLDPQIERLNVVDVDQTPVESSPVKDFFAMAKRLIEKKNENENIDEPGIVGADQTPAQSPRTKGFFGMIKRDGESSDAQAERSNVVDDDQTPEESSPVVNDIFGFAKRLAGKQNRTVDEPESMEVDQTTEQSPPAKNFFGKAKQVTENSSTKVERRKEDEESENEKATEPNPLSAETANTIANAIFIAKEKAAFLKEQIRVQKRQRTQSGEPSEEQNSTGTDTDDATEKQADDPILPTLPKLPMLTFGVRKPTEPKMPTPAPKSTPGLISKMPNSRPSRPTEPPIAFDSSPTGTQSLLESFLLRKPASKTEDAEPDSKNMSTYELQLKKFSPLKRRQSEEELADPQQVPLQKKPPGLRITSFFPLASTEREETNAIMLQDNEQSTAKSTRKNVLPKLPTRIRPFTQTPTTETTNNNVIGERPVRLFGVKVKSSKKMALPVADGDSDELEVTADRLKILILGLCPIVVLLLIAAR